MRVRKRGPGQVLFWVMAFFLGIAAGLAALGFRAGIGAMESLLYGADDQNVFSAASEMPWFLLILIPATGGLVVGVILHKFTADARVRAVADVIEGAALRRGRVEFREGLASAAASLITLGSGGSSGREGPVVHLAATISTWMATRIDASGVTGRDLLGCAVAGAVSASFNAPLAGAIFAMEVVLRHYALHAFAPIAIASVMGTVVNRLYFGNVAEFTLPVFNTVAFYWEIPAFLILGLVCGLVALALMRSIFWTEDLFGSVQARLGFPRWLRPAIAGAMVGAIAIVAPQVIGIGYEVTTLALTGQMLLTEAILIAVAKVIAVSITLGGRMGGGIFSPALVVGALTGLAFGLIATSLIPAYSGSSTTYALAGMGAVSAAVLGAPVSTSLIVFELTGDWQIAIAVLAAVSTATAVASRFVNRSFFLSQLSRRGVPIAQGPQAYLLQLVGIMRITQRPGSPRALPRSVLEDLAADGMAIDAHALLKEALWRFKRSGASHLAVTTTGADGVQVVGCISHVEALQAFNQALAAIAAEEHS
ncbi:chloride channel protein [Pararhodobacter sp.]|uniref:chloride channel protein n=1 Tax=Pararhodobacter sp. TaxID=2127056 RepID=UPI002AFEB970|nr:chloride channel protein [Pararhodobacter sp.]